LKRLDPNENGQKFEHRRVSKPFLGDFLADPDSRNFSRFYTNIRRSRYFQGPRLSRTGDGHGVFVWRKAPSPPIYLYEAVSDETRSVAKTGSGQTERNGAHSKRRRGVALFSFFPARVPAPPIPPTPRDSVSLPPQPTMRSIPSLPPITFTTIRRPSSRW